MIKSESLIARLQASIKIDPVSGCWLFTGRPSAKYPRIGIGKKYFQVHRVMYELVVGPIPDGHQIDHVAANGCTSTRCCNPKHLEAVTPKENVRRSRGFNKHKTHCVRGHEFDEANTHLRKNGKRHCRKCQAIRTAKSKELSK